jgi:hypothetical protein
LERKLSLIRSSVKVALFAEGNEVCLSYRALLWQGQGV